MKEATPEELRERYRNLPDEQLLIVAADITHVTPAAAKALHQELKDRKLSPHDVAETRASVNNWRAKENEASGGVLDIRKQFSWQVYRLAQGLVAGCVWLILGGIGKVVCNTPQSAARFQKEMFFACFVPYAFWGLVSIVRTARGRKFIDVGSSSDSGTRSLDTDLPNQK